MNMRDFLIKWFINIIALFAVVHIIAGVSVDSWQTTIVAALVLGMFNAFLRPFFLVMTLPFNILSLGLFTLFINGFMFYLAARFVKGFSISSFWNAFWAALLFSIISFLLNLLLSPENNIRVSRYGGGYSKKARYDDAIDVEGKTEEDN